MGLIVGISIGVLGCLIGGAAIGYFYIAIYKKKMNAVGNEKVAGFEGDYADANYNTGNQEVDIYEN